MRSYIGRLNKFQLLPHVKNGAMLAFLERPDP